jgi:twitching motility protein PilU
VLLRVHLDRPNDAVNTARMASLTKEQARAYMHKLLGGQSQAGSSDLFIANSLMNQRRREEFAKEIECNFAISKPDL